jgi:hypothetical protein
MSEPRVVTTRFSNLRRMTAGILSTAAKASPDIQELPLVRRLNHISGDGSSLTGHKAPIVRNEIRTGRP